MNTSLEYLLSYLQEEFSGVPAVRVRIAPEEKRQRSPDLIQQFDDERSRVRGVTVKVGSREFFFPETWVATRAFSEIADLAQSIKDGLER